MSRRRGALPLLAALACLLLPALAAAEPQQAQAPEQPQTPQQPGPQLAARSWGLIDARTGDVLTTHAGNAELPIASTTKLMTAYVAMKELPLDKIVRAAPYDAEYGESLMGLRTGERISVRDLIYGLILRSGNDAAHTLAIAAAGDEARFVAEMNRYAAALGLSHTHYANPIGLDQKGNYSSALDLMTLTRRLLAIPAFARIADSRTAVLRSVHPRRRIATINELLLMAPWVTGVKTGHTWKAGYVLVGSGEKRGIKLISVAIDAPTDETRFSDNMELLEWGFRQYHRRKAIRKGKELASPSIRYSGGELPLLVGHSLKVAMRDGQKVEVDVDAPAEVTGPIRRGARLGTATVSIDGLRAGSVPLVASRRIPAASAFDKARGFVGEHLVPLAIAVCAILAIAILLGRSVRRIRRGKRVEQK